MERDKVATVEADKLRDIRRFCNICKGLSQVAISFPNTSETIDQADRDNLMIDINTEKIKSYKENMAQNISDNIGMVGSANYRIETRIYKAELEISQLKLGPKTSDEIIKDDWSETKVRLSGTVR